MQATSRPTHIGRSGRSASGVSARSGRSRQTTAQANDEGHEDQRLRHRPHRLARLRLPGGVFLQHANEPVRRRGHQQHVARHDGNHQQRAPKPARGQQPRGDPRQQMLGNPVAEHREHQRHDQRPDHSGAGSLLHRLGKTIAQAGHHRLQARQIVRPGRFQVAPEFAGQRRGGALGDLRLEEFAALRHQFGGALPHVDGEQSRQPDVGIQRIAFFREPGPLARDVRVFGGAGGRGIAEFAQARVQVRQFAGARGDELVGLRTDVADLRQQLAHVLVGIGGSGDLGELLAQLGHRWFWHRGRGGAAGADVAVGLGHRRDARQQGGQAKGHQAGDQTHGCHHRRRHFGPAARRVTACVGPLRAAGVNRRD
jgi:hypothetical protein